MKHLLLLLAIASLAGCAAGPKSSEVIVSNSSTPQAIRAFEEICLKTAPSFERATVTAQTFGIASFTEFGPGKAGFNADQSLGVQIKEGMECVVTTPSQKDHGLTRIFIQTVAQAAGANPAGRVPFRAEVAGQTFAFQHDRSGGEAFVMLKLKK